VIIRPPGSPAVVVRSVARIARLSPLALGTSIICPVRVEKCLSENLTARYRARFETALGDTQDSMWHSFVAIFSSFAEPPKRGDRP